MRSATAGLILLNVLVYLLQGELGDRLLASYALWPVGHFWIAELNTYVGFQPWQLITSAFLHANLTHLFLNLFALYMFGKEVERELGMARFLELYFVSVLSAALVQLAVVSFNVEQPHPTLGASGGVFGVLLAFGRLFPHSIVTPLFPPIPMRAWVFVGLYAIIELTSGVFGTQQGVAHFAHLGGMLGAYLLLHRWQRPRALDFR